MRAGRSLAGWRCELASKSGATRDHIMPQQRSVFVSYRHTEREWVLGRLVPCLKAGGADVHVDVERFKAGRTLVGQMDAEQDAAELQVLVLTEEYFQSDYCMHEFRRALKRDPQFKSGVVVPVLRDKVDWRRHIMVKKPPLLVDLQADGRRGASRERKKELPKQWARLLEACAAELGTAAADWLGTRDEVLRHLQRNESVNLVVSAGVAWGPLLKDVRRWLVETPGDPGLAIVDLEDGETATRRTLVAKILRECGVPADVPSNDEELAVFTQRISAAGLRRLALCHFDLIRGKPYYDVDLFGALKHLMMDYALDGSPKRLTLLVHSRAPFSTLLPADASAVFTTVAFATVELRGRPS